MKEHHILRERLNAIEGCLDNAAKEGWQFKSMFVSSNDDVYCMLTRDVVEEKDDTLEECVGCNKEFEKKELFNGMCDGCHEEFNKDIDGCCSQCDKILPSGKLDKEGRCDSCGEEYSSGGYCIDCVEESPLVKEILNNDLEFCAGCDKEFKKKELFNGMCDDCNNILNKELDKEVVTRGKSAIAIYPDKCYHHQNGSVIKVVKITNGEVYFISYVPWLPGGCKKTMRVGAFEQSIIDEGFEET